MANNQPSLIQTFQQHETRLQNLFKTHDIEWEFLQTWFESHVNPEYQKAFLKILEVYNSKIVLASEFTIQEQGSLSWSEYTKFNILMGDIYRNIEKLVEIYIGG